MTMHGIDVSHWQSGLWLADTDAEFAIMKATEGTSYVDASCAGFVAQAKAANMPWGVYHFYQGNPIPEADHFLDSVAGYIGHGLLVLDFETHTSDVAGAKAWLDHVYTKTGIRPLIYMSQSVAAGHDWSAVARDYGLWVARYNTEIGPTGAWDAVTMWQYTDAHRTGGMSVDGDHFYGDRETWTALATGEHRGGGDTGGDDVPDYINTAYSTNHTIPADGEWHGLQIGTDPKWNFLDGPVYCSGVLSVNASAEHPDTEVNLRAISVDTRSGHDTVPVSQFPFEEYRTAGGQTQMVLPFAQHVAKASGDWTRRLRFQIRAYGGGELTVNDARARAIYW